VRDKACCLLQAGLVHVDEDETGALACHGQGRSPADAAGPTRDEDFLAAKAEVHYTATSVLMT
jgi:hypothetical protein